MTVARALCARGPCGHRRLDPQPQAAGGVAVIITILLFGLHGRAERGSIPTEAVLKEMRESDFPVHYLVGTPQGRLSRFEKALLAQSWREARPGVDVKLLPKNGELYCLRAEPGSGGEGTGHSAAEAQAIVSTSQATLGDDPHTRGRS